MSQPAWSAGATELPVPYSGGAVESDPATGAVLGVDLGVAKVSFVSPARLYRHPDFRGNTSFVSDETGAVVAHYRYSAYGVDLVLGTDADAQRFAGRLELTGGLVLMGARIYDPLVGRFLSQDPVFQELNPYSYTLGNPLDFWDPDGAAKNEIRAAWAVQAAGFALVAVVVGTTGPFGLAAALTARIVFAALAIDVAIDTFVPEGLGSALDGSPNFGSGPCKSKCGPGNQKKVVVIGPADGEASPSSPPPPPPSAPAAPCAPSNMESAPNLGALLLILIPAQLLLGVLCLRRRVSEKGGRTQHG